MQKLKAALTLLMHPSKNGGLPYRLKSPSHVTSMSFRARAVLERTDLACGRLDPGEIKHGPLSYEGNRTIDTAAYAA
jgi:hypothetical protein